MVLINHGISVLRSSFGYRLLYPQQSMDELGVLIREKEKEFGHPIILVADDIYRRLVFDGLTSGDVLLSHPHSIRVHSHSKDLGLPGERIGFIAVHPGIPERETICQGLVLANRILGFVNAPALMQQILPCLLYTSPSPRDRG